MMKKRPPVTLKQLREYTISWGVDTTIRPIKKPYFLWRLSSRFCSLLEKREKQHVESQYRSPWDDGVSRERASSVCGTIPNYKCAVDKRNTLRVFIRFLEHLASQSCLSATHFTFRMLVYSFCYLCVSFRIIFLSFQNEILFTKTKPYITPLLPTQIFNLFSCQDTAVFPNDDCLCLLKGHWDALKMHMWKRNNVNEFVITAGLFARTDLFRCHQQCNGNFMEYVVTLLSVLLLWIL